MVKKEPRRADVVETRDTEDPLPRSNYGKGEWKNQHRAEIVNESPCFVVQLDDEAKTRKQHMNEQDQQRDATRSDVPHITCGLTVRVG